MVETTFLKTVATVLDESKFKILPKKVKDLIVESEKKSSSKPTLEQIKYIFTPFLRILFEKTQDVLHLFASPMRFGKTQSIWRLLIPLYHILKGGRLTFVFASSVSEVTKSDKWKHKRKVGNFDYFGNGDNVIVLFSSETQTGMKNAWRRFCETEAENFKNSEYKDYTLTIVMITGFAKDVLQDKSGCLDKLVKASGTVAPLVLWDECGINLLPHHKFAPAVFGNGSEKLYGKNVTTKFINGLFTFKKKYDSPVFCFSATLNALHKNEADKLFEKPFYKGILNKEKSLKAFNKRLRNNIDKFVPYEFQIEHDTIVPAEDSRYTTSVLTNISSFLEDDFSKVLQEAMHETMCLNLWNSENWKRCGIPEASKDRNILLALGNDNHISGMNALTFIEFWEGMGIFTKTLEEYNASVTDDHLKINDDRVCIAHQNGIYLLSDTDLEYPLSDGDVERKCNDGSILILIVKNKYQTGFDCSNFYRTILCKQYIQHVAERKGAAINIQKPGQTAGRAAGTHSGVIGVFGWKEMKKAVTKVYEENENKAYKVMEWFVKNNSFASYVLADKENKYHTADSTRDYIQASYPSTKQNFMDYLWDTNWEIDFDFDSKLKKQIISDPVPEELKINQHPALCPCTNCDLKKGHKAA